MGLKMYEKPQISRSEMFNEYLTMRGWKDIEVNEEKKRVIIPYDDIYVIVEFSVDNNHPEKAELVALLKEDIVLNSFKNENTGDFDEIKALNYVNNLNFCITGLKAVLHNDKTKAITFHLVLQYPENMLFQHIESYISTFHNKIAEQLSE